MKKVSSRSAEGREGSERSTHTTEDGLSSVLLRRSDSERKDGLVKETLVDHVVERRNSSSDGDVVVGES